MFLILYLFKCCYVDIFFIKNIGVLYDIPDIIASLIIKIKTIR